MSSTGLFCDDRGTCHFDSGRLAEILRPLGSSSSGGPKGDGARAAVMGHGNVGREVEERWIGGGGRGGREVIITGFHL